MSGGFKDLESAMQFREVIAGMVRSMVAQLRPEPIFGRVVEVQRAARTCDVVFPGDEDPVRCRIYHGVQPGLPGGIVRVEGKPGNMIVTEVISGSLQSDGAGASEFAISSVGGKRARTMWAIELNAPGVGNTCSVGTFVPNDTSLGVVQVQSTINVTLTGRGINGAAKEYVFHVGYDQADDIWRACVPSPGTGGAVLGNDMGLEVMVDSTTFEVNLRVRSRLVYGDDGYLAVVEINGVSFTLKSESSNVMSSPAAVSLPHHALLESWADVTFQNSWVNYGGTYQDVQYRAEPGGIIRLRGLMKSGTPGSSAFTLPAGFRPVERHIFPVVGGTSVGARLDVLADGTVVPHSSIDNTFVSLSGVAFSIQA